MADPKAENTELAKFVTDVFDRMENTVRVAIRDAYRLGYANGDRDAIARVLQAARPTSAGQGTNGTQSPSEGAGAETHKLIALVMQASTPSGKATPTEIQRSPANKDRITVGAISKALRRGVKNKLYATDGSGFYWQAGGTK